MRKYIFSAEDSTPENPGTTFYIVTLEDVKRAYQDDDNIIFNYLLNTEGLDAFSLDSLYGSVRIDNFIVICDTDGYDIEINGEMVDPETALDEYDLDDIESAGYVSDDVDDSTIRRYLSKYELATVDIDDIALELLQASHHFDAIVEAAQDLDLIEM